MDWYPNEDAAIHFADEILPRIRTKHHDVKFYVVGQDPTDRLQQLGNRPEIIVTGRVEEIQPYI